jgi:hypothetical protein
MNDDAAPVGSWPWALEQMKAVKEVSTYSTASDSAYALGLADACKAIAARINNTEG